MGSLVKTLTWPLRLEHGALASAEQDSAADVQSCVTAILAYPKGWRHDNVDFGRPDDILFTEGGADASAIAEAIRDQEPRATPDVVARALEAGRQSVPVSLEGEDG
jgi:hypothetical protein